MKRILVCATLVLFAHVLFAAAPDSGYVHPGKFSAISEVILFPQKTFQSLGIQIEASVGRHLYLNYHFSMGSTSQGGLYVHSTLGGAGGMALVVHNIGTKGIGWAAILLCFIPEGIGYSFDLGKKMEVVPYFNPAQCDYRINNSSYGEEFNFSGDAGSRIVFKFPNSFFFQVHGGVKLLYNHGEWGAEGGVSFGKFL